MNNIKLKICGVMSVEESEKLKTAKVDYIGLNFVKDSPRCISFKTAESITGDLRGSSIKIVALFRDHPIFLVNDYAEKLKVDYIQLHGNETNVYAQNVIKPVIKAIPIKDSTNAGEIIEYIASYPARYFVLDRPVQGQGNIINALIANKIIAKYPDKIFLAGGLNPDNLAKTLEQTLPFGIDIASGVRINNVLDIAKVIEVLRIIRAA